MNQLRIITLIVIHFIYFQAQLRANVFLALEEQDAAKVSNLKLYIFASDISGSAKFDFVRVGASKNPPLPMTQIRNRRRQLIVIY